MSIKCGNCKGRHETIAEVRACCAGVTAPAGVSAYGPSLTRSYDAETARRASLAPTTSGTRGTGAGSVRTSANGILAQLKRAAAQPVAPVAQPTAPVAQPVSTETKTLSLEERDALITTMRREAAQPVSYDIPPAGRYAIERDGVLKFYRVDRPTEGRWAGYTFLKVQAGDEYWPVKDPSERGRILDQIALDARAAMVRYGREIGECGHCGRTLTDAASREAGIGPICASKI